MLSDGIAVSKTTNTTLKIYYVNLESDNEETVVKIFDGENLVFQHLENEEPNEITLYFDYSTLSLNEEMLKLQLELTKVDGTSSTITKYVSTAGRVGLIQSEVAAILSIIFVIFGFTLTSSKTTFNYFGMIVLVIALGITVLAVPVWYITFMQVIIGILLIITIFIYKKENTMIT
jgi:hypothetical protein